MVYTCTCLWIWLKDANFHHVHWDDEIKKHLSEIYNFKQTSIQFRLKVLKGTWTLCSGGLSISNESERADKTKHMTPVIVVYYYSGIVCFQVNVHYLFIFIPLFGHVRMNKDIWIGLMLSHNWVDFSFPD